MEEIRLYRIESRVLMNVVVTAILLLREPASVQDWVQWRVFVNSVMDSLFTRRVESRLDRV